MSRFRFAFLSLAVLCWAAAWASPSRAGAPSGDLTPGKARAEAATYRARDPDRPRWWLALYQGFFTPKYFSELFTTRPELEDQWFRGAGLGRELLAWRDMGLEVEVVYADHYGSQDFQEGVAVLLARWHALWGEGWRLSGAVGEGVSYATEIPWFEAAEGKSTQWINYLAFELEAGHAAASPFSLVARIHHRSSVFKLIGNGEADSNYWTLGLRARF